MTDICTWHLDEAVIAPTVAKLKKINARARAHGLAGRYGYRLGKEHREPVYLDAGYEADSPVCQQAEPDYYRVTREFIVEGEPPKLGGWSFLATLTWDVGVLVTRTEPGFTGTIDADGIRPQWCDHCQTDRQRLDTYLLEHEDGRRCQVGSTCIKDFLGHSFSPSLIRGGADLDEIERCFGGRGDNVAATLDVLSWAASMTAREGWISRDKAEIEHRDPSSAILRELLFSDRPAARKARQELRPSDAHRAEALNVLRWAREVETGGSEYLANVKRLAGAEYITPRNAGIIGSAVASFWRERNAAAERAARPVSQWFGQPKQRLEVMVTVQSESVFPTDFGVTHLYTLVTPEGNVAKWFSTRDAQLANGSQLRIRGTVKAHDEYREVQQTILTRCAVLEIISPAGKEAAAGDGPRPPDLPGPDTGPAKPPGGEHEVMPVRHARAGELEAAS